MKTIKEYWKELSPKGKKILVLLNVGICVAILLLWVCLDRSKTSNRKEEPAEAPALNQLGTNSRALQKDQYREMSRELGDMKKKIDGVLQSASSQSGQPISASTHATPPPPPETVPLPQVPKPADMPAAGSLPLPPSPPPPLEPREEFVGSIAEERGQADPDLKKKEDRIYLPPSFMAATLLSGLDAPALDMGKGNPVPVLIRIKDLAFLPNSVRADLKGCFVIADGHGSLSDERAHLRLVNLSCLSRKGQSVVDQKIKGFVVDEDGKIGIRGKVVSRMGSVVARVALAGFISGVGKGFQESTLTQSITASGVTKTADPSKAGLSGVSTGFSAAVDELSKFYLRLAEATLPVIEIGSSRKITMVIQEGVDLEIKPLTAPVFK
jgi:conjugal transfer pilus assembly protein TraB